MSGVGGEGAGSALTRKQFLGGAAALAAGVTFSAACGGSSEPVRRAGQNGTLVVDLELESASFNGLDWNHQHIRWVIDQIQESLYVYDDNLKPVPLLADGLPTVIDPLNVEVKVKDGIRFQNGDRLTGEHVFATYRELVFGEGHIWTSHLERVADVELVNPSTIRFILKEPWALLIDPLSQIPIMHKDYLTQRDEVMGTGPFSWLEHEQGSHVLVKANTQYRNGAPQLAEIRFRFVPDAGARVVNLLRGDSQLLPALPYQNFPQMQENEDITTYDVVAPVDVLHWVSSKTLPDVRVRQALAYAIDRQRIKDVVFRGLADIGQGPVHTAQYGSDNAREIYPARPDVAKAKSLLEAAGVSNLSFDHVSTSDQATTDMGAILQENWAAIGVDANFSFLELGAWADRWVSGDWGMAAIFSIDGQAFGKSPAVSLNTLVSSSSTNFGEFNNSEYDSLKSEVEVTQDENARNRLYGLASDVAAEQVGMIPPVYPHFIIATRKNVTGLPETPLQINRIILKDVSF